MITKVRVTTITHDGFYREMETTPIEIETCKTNILQGIYDMMEEAEAQRQTLTERRRKTDPKDLVKDDK